ENLHEKAITRVEDIRAAYPEYVEKAEAGLLKRFSLGNELKVYHSLHHGGTVSDKVLMEMDESLGRRIRTMKLRPVQELQLPPEELLTRVPFFSELTPEIVRTLCAVSAARSFLKGEDIVRQGEQGDSLFIIGRGKVEVLVKEPDGTMMKLTELQTGDFFGETALLHPQPRTATVRSLVPGIMLELRRDNLLPVLEQAPGLSERLERAYRNRVLNTLLAHIPIFHDIGDEGRKAIAAHMELLPFREGQVLEEEGSQCRRLLLVREGELEIKGADVLRAGDYYGDKEIMEQKSCPGDLLAVSDGELYSISAADVREILNDH
ncbi:cyclic nucleotide-binding domain-containing protein, partial [Nitrospirota bacterium]